ncbi:hypothetical protein [Sphingobium sp. EP60837]|uniref:hypothetical protein n=1 Tax=Sphingobium sp. EP60837 TaxID=1855519 RepID=UPI0007DD1815|nr:hypothetical protein [Sphingobium sp. EP60837]ANI79004.1 hypothetical protein EP837_02609 [Sphingobium sp. EP60837]
MAQDWFDQGVSQAAPQGAPRSGGLQPITIGRPDPKLPLEMDRIRQQMEMERIRVQLAQDAAARARNEQDKPPAGYRWNSTHTGFEFVPGGPADPATKQSGAPQLSAKERADAIAAFNSAKRIDQTVAQLRELYKSGPGATSGLKGLQDYFPSTANKRFDTAGNKSRGDVGQALGFTGGQLNTAAEAEMAVGPYLPKAGDRDEVILDKINSLEGLARNARERSIAVLGGAPDANGRVTPVDPNKRGNDGAAALPPSAPPPSMLGPSAAAPVVDPSGNREFSTEVDKALAAEAQAAFNAGASREQIDAIAAKYGAQPFGPDLDQAIKGRQAGARTQFSTPTTGRESAGLAGQMLGGMASGPLGSYTINAGNAVTAGGLDEVVGWMGGNPAVAQVAKDMSLRDHPYAGLAGSMTGAALASLGATKALGAIPSVGGKLATMGGGIVPDALYGAAFGAGENNDDRLTGALFGAGSSAAGNVIGRGMFGGAGRAVRGVSDPAVRYLKNRGVPLTVGQMMGQNGVIGRTIKGVEDKFESIPYLGDAIRQRREEGLDAFGRATFKDALEPIGQQVQGTVGNDAIEQAQGLVSQAYDNALGPVRLSADPAYQTHMAAARAAGGNLPGPLADTFNATLANRVDPFVGTGQMTGRDLQAAIKGLRTDAGSVIKKSEPMADLFKDRTVDIEDALMGLAERQAPGTGQAMKDANSAYRNLSILEDATLAADNAGGRYTPAQLGRAMISNTKRFGGKRAAASGDMPFRDLQSAGQQVLPSTTPNSGTTDRALATWVLPATVGGVAATGDLTDYLPTEAAIPLTLAGLASTKGGRTALEKMLLGRSEAARSIGDKIYDNRRIGGMFGSPLLLGLSQGQ